MSTQNQSRENQNDGKGFISFLLSLPSTIVSLIISIIEMHILLAALLYPGWLLPQAVQEGVQEKRTIYKVTSICFGLLLLVLNLFVCFVLFTRPTLIDFAKVLFIQLIWFFTAIALILFNHRGNIQAMLFFLEEEAVQIRDESVMLIRTGQATLRAFNRKIQGESDEQQSAFVLAKSIGPLALMFVKKEKNIVRVALATLKFFGSGAEFIKGLSNKN
jgi:hypothetical protein